MGSIELHDCAITPEHAEFDHGMVEGMTQDGSGCVTCRLPFDNVVELATHLLKVHTKGKS